ncbi:MAG: type II toxin-antitoxin system VapC family toxin [Opitutales bacterium]|nr:type II toxin-antitoxin system VapC family toxin [Opitutales bacterium]MCH8541389.1 type II toxin-antitoxin system VapC family toxin [Opitutales bacterium]
MRTAAERIFVDTNVFLSATDRDRETHGEAIAFLEEGFAGKHRLFASSQIFREYLVVATRPISQNGLGLTATAAVDNVRKFQQLVHILEENRETSDRLIELTQRHTLRGKRIHDANILATMQANGLTHLKTWNPADFETFPGITLC